VARKKPKAKRRHKPGEYPMLRTGQLRRNIVMQHNPATLTTKIGTSVVYGKYLELGFRGVRYPWLSRGITEHMATIKRIMSTGKV
jgi:hypothetical protein